MESQITQFAHLFALSDHKVFCIFVKSVFWKCFQFLGQKLEHLLPDVVVVLMLSQNVLEHPFQNTCNHSNPAFIDLVTISEA